MDIQTILQSISGRAGIYGVRTADQYQREIVPDEANAEAWRRNIEASATKLTFSSPDTLVDVKSIAKGDDAVSGVLMQFNAILTTSKRDRDGDVLVTANATLDPNMPLLWQHCTMQPIGRYVRTVRHTDEELECRFEIADIPLGRDAAVLIGMGALRMSHGFEPDMDYIEQMSDGKGWMFKKFHIFEASVVSIPANVDAVITAYTDKRLQTPEFQRWAKSYADRRPVIVGVALDLKNEPSETRDVSAPSVPTHEGTDPQPGLDLPSATRAQETASHDEPSETPDIKFRSVARMPTYDGTESAPWSKPTLDDYLAGLDLPSDTTWADLTRAQKTRMASQTLIGEATAATFEDMNRFPVVNPRNHKLNENAVKNAKARAPQADLPEDTQKSIQKVCDRLLDMHFTARSYDVVERELLAASVGQNPDRLRQTADCLRRISDAIDEQVLDACLEVLLQEL